MPKPLKTALAAGMMLMAGEAARAADIQPARPQFAQGSMNVYRRFAPADRDRMIAFYDKVLGLKSLSPINLGGGQQMILFGIGSGQIKLASGLKDGRQYHVGGVNEAIGIRLFTLHYPDEAALTARFVAAGYPAPAFKDVGGVRGGPDQERGGDEGGLEGQAHEVGSVCGDFT